jgi:hypothetical protein
VAVPARLELATFGLGNRCSILLSYGTAKQRFYFKTRHFESASMPGVTISGKITRGFARTAPGRPKKALPPFWRVRIPQSRNYDKNAPTAMEPQGHPVVISALNNRHCCVAVGSSAWRRNFAHARRRRNGSIPTQKFLNREARSPAPGLRRIAIRTGRKQASGAKVSALLTRCLLSGD